MSRSYRYPKVVVCGVRPRYRGAFKRIVRRIGRRRDDVGGNHYRKLTSREFGYIIDYHDYCPDMPEAHRK